MKVINVFRVSKAVLLLILLSSCMKKPSELKFDDTNLAQRVPASVIQKSSASDYDISPVIADRSYVESVLAQVFSISQPALTTSIASTGMAATLESAIYVKKEFGGGCDRYAASELTKPNEFPRAACGGMNPTQLASSNPMRYSFIIKICEQLISNSAIFTAAMIKIDPNWTTQMSKPSAKTITIAYQLFSPVGTPSEELINNLLDSTSKVSAPDEAWKIILTTFCSSPEWQVF